MGRSRLKETGAIVVEHQSKGLAGLVKILLMKKGKKEERTVVFSAVLEIEDGSENDKKYNSASIVPSMPTYPSNQTDLKKTSNTFINGTIGYLEKKGFKVYK